MFVRTWVHIVCRSTSWMSEGKLSVNNRGQEDSSIVVALSLSLWIYLSLPFFLTLCFSLSIIAFINIYQCWSLLARITVYFCGILYSVFQAAGDWCVSVCLCVCVYVCMCICICICLEYSPLGEIWHTSRCSNDFSCNTTPLFLSCDTFRLRLNCVVPTMLWNLPKL